MFREQAKAKLFEVAIDSVRQKIHLRHNKFIEKPYNLFLVCNLLAAISLRRFQFFDSRLALLVSVTCGKLRFDLIEFYSNKRLSLFNVFQTGRCILDGS